MKTRKILVDWPAERKKIEDRKKTMEELSLVLDAYYNEFLKMIESMYDEKSGFSKKDFMYSILSTFITKTIVAPENVHSN